MKERKSQSYKSSNDFRTALLERLKKISISDGIDVNRLQRHVAFDRLLCRLFAGRDVPWILKGGHALELRLHNSRATKDLDLALKDMKLFSAEDDEQRNDAILERLREKASVDLGDFFVFAIGKPIADLDAAPYGGSRFPVDVTMAGRPFVRFHLDVGIGDAWFEPHERLELSDWLGFAGIETAKVPVISPEQHFAEKLHAYTLPRDGRMNSRVKDLVDIVLLIKSGNLDVKKLRDAITKTFAHRATHELPVTLPSPPPEWEKPFAALAIECDAALVIDEAFELVEKFFADAVTRGH
jgi:predicted nucleotidyltransferase component of viral defense system